MAVNKWVNPNIEAGSIANVGNVMPGKVFAFAQTFEVGASDGNGSIYKLAKIDSNLIPLKLEINCDALAGATDIDIGFYKENGVVVDKDVLLDGADIHAGAALGSEINGLGSLGVDNIGKKVYELLGKTSADKDTGYILAITANAASTAAGTISVRGLFIQG